MALPMNQPHAPQNEARVAAQYADSPAYQRHPLRAKPMEATEFQNPTYQQSLFGAGMTIFSE